MNLLHEIGAYCRDHNVAVTSFGRQAVSDPRFVIDLRNGRQPRAGTVERVRKFLAGDA